VLDHAVMPALGHGLALEGLGMLGGFRD